MLQFSVVFTTGVPYIVSDLQHKPKVSDCKSKILAGHIFHSWNELIEFNAL